MRVGVAGGIWTPKSLSARSRSALGVTPVDTLYCDPCRHAVPADLIGQGSTSVDTLVARWVGLQRRLKENGPWRRRSATCEEPTVDTLHEHLMGTLYKH